MKLVLAFGQCGLIFKLNHLFPFPFSFSEADSVLSRELVDVTCS
jgi:hypothetical protein